MPAQVPDQDQVEAFLRGDTGVVQRLRALVRGVVRGFRIAGAAENLDLVQDTLTRVYANLSAGQYRGESSLETYARRIARFTCLEHIRRRRREVELDAESLASHARWAGPEDTFLWSEEHLRNVKVFSCLTPDCRELLRLVFEEGLSYKDVASRLGLTEGAIKTRVCRCRRTFRQAAGLPGASPASRAIPKGVRRNRR
jgi:RNA polymerase sigma factor (sigma-70 family)